MKTKVLFFVLASAFLAMLVMGCEQSSGGKGDAGAIGPAGPVGEAIRPEEFVAFTTPTTAIDADTTLKTPATTAASMVFAAETGLATTGIEIVYVAPDTAANTYSASAFAEKVKGVISATLNADAAAIVAATERKSLASKITLGTPKVYDATPYTANPYDLVVAAVTGGTTNVTIVIPITAKDGYYNVGLTEYVVPVTGVTTAGYWGTQTTVARANIDATTVKAEGDIRFDLIKIKDGAVDTTAETLGLEGFPLLITTSSAKVLTGAAIATEIEKQLDAVLEPLHLMSSVVPPTTAAISAAEQKVVVTIKGIDGNYITNPASVTFDLYIRSITTAIGTLIADDSVDFTFDATSSGASSVVASSLLTIADGAVTSGDWEITPQADGAAKASEINTVINGLISEVLEADTVLKVPVESVVFDLPVGAREIGVEVPSTLKVTANTGFYFVDGTAEKEIDVTVKVLVSKIVAET